MGIGGVVAVCATLMVYFDRVFLVLTSPRDILAPTGVGVTLRGDMVSTSCGRHFKGVLRFWFWVVDWLGKKRGE